VPDANPHRLPRTVVPRHYRLEVEPDLGAATFAGRVEVEAEVLEATSEVVLNAIELEIEQAWVEVGGRRVEAATSLDETTERATLSVPERLEPGPVTVGLAFRGILNDKLRGFYRSTFTDAEGTERTIATTQFEATDARRAFPCWDEPDLKATFGITLVVDRDLTVVSNAGVDSDRDLGDGRRRVTFADTMVMSTYLVAFIAGPLEVAGPIDVDGTPVRVLCPPGKLHLTPFALEVAAFSLRYLADYFDLAYPGDTLDLVAIPDFAFGAMENLGCVTFRETLLLVDPDRATQNELQNVVDVIAHELAHMWFGDLVTMRWWNGIWLNEAFATFLELRVTDAFRPEWQRWVGFGIARTAAFDTDSLGSTRPVEYEVLSPHDAEAMFDVLTYEKGAAVVRMLEQYLGEDRFRVGIRRYMDAHRYGNTETTDLWDAIEEATGEPVRRIMDSWIFQGGYPLVTVASGADGRVLHLSQERFRYLLADGHPGDGDADRSGEDGWAIPLVLRWGTADGDVVDSTALLDGAVLEIDLPEKISWVVANVGGSGFYRVAYEPALRAALAQQGADQLSALERYGLVDDTWGAVLAGAAPATDALALAEVMGEETDLAVWRRVVATLDQLDRMVAHDPSAADRLHARARAVLASGLDHLGTEPVDDEPDRAREARGVLLGALATLGDDGDARRLAVELFERGRAEPGSVEPNLAAAAVRVVAAGAGPAEVDAILDGFRTAATPQEEIRYLYSLGEVRDPDQQRRVLELALTDAVRTQNAPYLVSASLACRAGAGPAWAFVTERWSDLLDRFPSNSIDRMLSGIRTISDRVLADEVEQFLAANPVPQAKQTIDQHIERMWVTVALHEREAAPLAGALRD
jgi:puromycin-sensitive aminopeptidase